ncbi:hypothetical protein LINPERPRIM_LOCUS36245 [Linum perenne]
MFCSCIATEVVSLIQKVKTLHLLLPTPRPEEESCLQSHNSSTRLVLLLLPSLIPMCIITLDSRLNDLQLLLSLIDRGKGLRNGKVLIKSVGSTVTGSTTWNENETAIYRHPNSRIRSCL